MNQSPSHRKISYRIILDLFSRGSMFIMNIFIARSLSVQDFGRIGYGMSTAQMFMILTDLGLTLDMVKVMGEKRDSQEAVWLDYFSLKMALSAGVFLLSLLFSSYLWRWNQSWLMVLFFCWMIGTAMFDFFQYICNAQVKIQLAQRLIILNRSIMIGSLLVAIVIAPSLMSIVGALAFGGLIGAIAVLIYFFSYQKQKIVLQVSIQKWKSIIARSVFNAVGMVFAVWYVRMGVICLGWFSSPFELGKYNAVMKIYEASYIIPVSIMSISMSQLAYWKITQFSQMRLEIRRLFNLMTGLSVSCFLFLYFFGEKVLRLLFGSKYAFEDQPMKMMALVIAVVVFNQFLNPLMVIVDKNKKLALNVFLTVIASFSASFILVPNYGVLGAIGGLLIAEIVLLSTNLMAYFRQMKLLGARV